MSIEGINPVIKAQPGHNERQEKEPEQNQAKKKPEGEEEAKPTDIAERLKKAREGGEIYG